MSSRLYHCCRCHTQIIICTRCDRGQRYCKGGCAGIARVESLKRACQKYQSSRAGRFNNAARQQRYRQQERQKVTHQGSTPKRLHDLLKTQLTRLKETPKPLLPSTTIHCHFCGEVVEPFLRHDFVHRHRVKRSCVGSHLFQNK